MRSPKIEKYVEQYLKQIINRKGTSYLIKNSYAIYEELIETDNVEFCKRNGFKLLSYECDGETSDYIPN